jgi:hypothetical protein
VTALLVAWGDGDRTALDSLLPLVYAELKRLAHARMRGERDGHSLQTTALVNEAYLRLVDYRRVRARDRSHFLAIAAQAMRRILIGRARARTAICQQLTADGRDCRSLVGASRARGHRVLKRLRAKESPGGSPRQPCMALFSCSIASGPCGCGRYGRPKMQRTQALQDPINTNIAGVAGQLGS